MSEDSVLHSILENARRELLDLTARNRLLNTARSSTRSGRLLNSPKGNGSENPGQQRSQT